MDAASTSEPRTAGRTSVDSVAAAFFGTFTLVARDLRRELDWMARDLATRQHLPDRPPHRPSATGYGHRP